MAAPFDSQSLQLLVRGPQPEGFAADVSGVPVGPFVFPAAQLLGLHAERQKLLAHRQQGPAAGFAPARAAATPAVALSFDSSGTHLPGDVGAPGQQDEDPATGGASTGQADVPPGGPPEPLDGGQAGAPKAVGGRQASGKGGGTSTYRGVLLHMRSRSWEAHIWSNKRQIHVGSFDSEIHAAVAFDIVALKLRGVGPTARLNFPLTTYLIHFTAIQQMPVEQLLESVRSSRLVLNERLEALKAAGHELPWDIQRLLEPPAACLTARRPTTSTHANSRKTHPRTSGASSGNPKKPRLRWSTHPLLNPPTNPTPAAPPPSATGDRSRPTLIQPTNRRRPPPGALLPPHTGVPAPAASSGPPVAMAPLVPLPPQHFAPSLSHGLSSSASNLQALSISTTPAGPTSPMSYNTPLPHPQWTDPYQPQPVPHTPAMPSCTAVSSSSYLPNPRPPFTTTTSHTSALTSESASAHPTASNACSADTPHNSPYNCPTDPPPTHHPDPPLSPFQNPNPFSLSLCDFASIPHDFPPLLQAPSSPLHIPDSPHSCSPPSSPLGSSCGLPSAEFQHILDLLEHAAPPHTSAPDPASFTPSLEPLASPPSSPYPPSQTRSPHSNHTHEQHHATMLQPLPPPCPSHLTSRPASPGTLQAPPSPLLPDPAPEHQPATHPGLQPPRSSGHCQEQPGHLQPPTYSHTHPAPLEQPASPFEEQQAPNSPSVSYPPVAAFTTTFHQTLASDQYYPYPTPNHEAPLPLSQPNQPHHHGMALPSLSTSTIFTPATHFSPPPPMSPSHRTHTHTRHSAVPLQPHPDCSPPSASHYHYQPQPLPTPAASAPPCTQATASTPGLGAPAAGPRAHSSPAEERIAHVMQTLHDTHQELVSLLNYVQQQPPGATALRSHPPTPGALSPDAHRQYPQRHHHRTAATTDQGLPAAPRYQTPVQPSRSPHPRTPYTAPYKHPHHAGTQAAPHPGPLHHHHHHHHPTPHYPHTCAHRGTLPAPSHYHQHHHHDCPHAHQRSPHPLAHHLPPTHHPACSNGNLWPPHTYYPPTHPAPHHRPAPNRHNPHAPSLANSTHSAPHPTDPAANLPSTISPTPSSHSRPTLSLPTVLGPVSIKQEHHHRDGPSARSPPPVESGTYAHPLPHNPVDHRHPHRPQDLNSSSLPPRAPHGPSSTAPVHAAGMLHHPHLATQDQHQRASAAVQQHSAHSSTGWQAASEPGGPWGQPPAGASSSGASVVHASSSSSWLPGRQAPAPAQQAQQQPSGTGPAPQQQLASSSTGWLQQHHHRQQQQQHQ